MRRKESIWLTNESSGHSELEGNGHPWLSCDHYNQVQQKIGPSIVLAMSGARNLFCIVIIHYMSVCELLRKVYLNFKYQPGFFVLQCIDRGWHWIQDRLGRLALKTFPLFSPLLNKKQIIQDYIEGRRGLYFVTTRMRQLKKVEAAGAKYQAMSGLLPVRVTRTRRNKLWWIFLSTWSRVETKVAGS